MKLSVLIPVYNAERFIERCLNSLIIQDLDKNEYEIIIINDGSTDNSLEIVENYSKEHANVVFYSHENQGVVATRNKLLKHAKGTYIYFLDADDYLAHNSFGVILEFALKNDIDIIGFKTLVTSCDNLVSLDKKNVDLETQKIVSGSEYLSKNNNIRVEIWWYFVKKEFLEENNILFIPKGYDDDLGFTLTLFLKAKKVVHYPIEIHRYYQSSESTMRGNNKISKRRISEYFMALILDFTKIINDLENQSFKHQKTIKSNFTLRRNTLTFFTIIKLIKAQFNLSIVKEKINQLEMIKAYPIGPLNREENNVLKFRMLIFIINHKQMLYSVVSVCNFLRKLFSLKSLKLNK